jgi:hypothetical protein
MNNTEKVIKDNSAIGVDALEFIDSYSPQRK